MKRDTSTSSQEDARATSSQSRIMTTVADKWRYNISSPENLEQGMTPADKNARQLRHEAFRKKLLGENSVFIRRKSDANEAKDVIEDGSGGETAATETETSGDESDRAFKDLQDMFLQKHLKGKAKSKTKSRVLAAQAPVVSSTGKGKKKVEELGPSGKTYTPLENQVRFSF
jgi:DNA mismatch repair protein MSH3